MVEWFFNHITRRQYIVFLSSLVVLFEGNLLEWWQLFSGKILWSGGNFARGQLSWNQLWYSNCFRKFLNVKFSLSSNIKLLLSKKNVSKLSEKASKLTTNIMFWVRNMVILTWITNVVFLQSVSTNKQLFKYLCSRLYLASFI